MPPHSALGLSRRTRCVSSKRPSAQRQVPESADPSNGELLAGPWTLRGSHIDYTVAVPAHGQWLELIAWGPNGVSVGASPFRFSTATPFVVAGDAAAVEFATDAVRPFAGADL